MLVRNRHAVPNALLPVVALMAINFGFVLSGAIAVEAIFSWPGLGLATYEALKGPDLPMLQGLFLVFSASVILFNLIADLLYALPRSAGARPHERGRRSRPLGGSPGCGGGARSPGSGRTSAATGRAWSAWSC